MKQWIISFSAWSHTGYAHLPGFLDAETKEDAEAFAIETAREHIFPVVDGWHNHTVTVGEIALMKEPRANAHD